MNNPILIPKTIIIPITNLMVLFNSPSSTFYFTSFSSINIPNKLAVNKAVVLTNPSVDINNNKLFTKNKVKMTFIIDISLKNQFPKRTMTTEIIIAPITSVAHAYRDIILKNQLR